ncbi:SAF domain-containing protein [Gordonia sp. ABSL1-1]|uniref:SAF domain-containing protein n=1 Tax=Gordonia sp. ABSL1-1 TaxID=3053923 RepID=UPI002572BB1C|nr:SAF domain-containing protein [Gordonia sp. ABSL1-1]MDL9938960.1 SAF domain-containing protein [Gordonia sp. ABSL1-1]
MRIHRDDVGRTTLSPRLIDRLRHLTRPGWVRTVLIRRSLAVVLLLVAVTVAITGRNAAADRRVLVATHDLLPGHILTAGDLELRDLPGSLLPDGSLTRAEDGTGRTTTGRVRTGEIITDARLLSPRLPGALTGQPGARLVPVRLADDSTTALLRAGDVVDVLSPADVPAGIGPPVAREASPAGRVLAYGAVVAVPAEAADGGLTGHSAGRPVLLAMEESAAHRVAAASLDSALAIVLH